MAVCRPMPAFRWLARGRLPYEEGQVRCPQAARGERQPMSANGITADVSDRQVKSEPATRARWRSATPPGCMASSLTTTIGTGTRTELCLPRPRRITR